MNTFQHSTSVFSFIHLHLTFFTLPWGFSFHLSPDSYNTSHLSFYLPMSFTVSTWGCWNAELFTFLLWENTEVAATPVCVCVHVFASVCKSVYAVCLCSSAGEQACLRCINLVMWKLLRLKHRVLLLSLTKKNISMPAYRQTHTNTHKPLTGWSLRSEKRNLNPLSLAIC